MKLLCIDGTKTRENFWNVQKGHTYTVSMMFHDGVTLLEDTQVHPLGTTCKHGSNNTVCIDGRFKWNAKRFAIINDDDETRKTTKRYLEKCKDT